MRNIMHGCLYNIFFTLCVTYRPNDKALVVSRENSDNLWTSISVVRTLYIFTQQYVSVKNRTIEHVCLVVRALTIYGHLLSQQLDTAVV